ncbi:hypothetical protein CANARDRAFT_27395 [[Candida] arabinofermentans NRRL YB-2248]|uniref:Uncharacterized protein n=1 Tax=[Candida] arabinofermentans NRRL YB-2248 TaxID=983967 RepID=A0A1E4T366_9ASCO|nr:hypothetical protein CANARDRAFT_27395 [[Candida] arabinofermentans NRRL YB-2248]
MISSRPSLRSRTTTSSVTSTTSSFQYQEREQINEAYNGGPLPLPLKIMREYYISHKPASKLQEKQFKYVNVKFYYRTNLNFGEFWHLDALELKLLDSYSIKKVQFQLFEIYTFVTNLLSNLLTLRLQILVPLEKKVEKLSELNSRSELQFYNMIEVVGKFVTSITDSITNNLFLEPESVIRQLDVMIEGIVPCWKTVSEWITECHLMYNTEGFNFQDLVHSLATETFKNDLITGASGYKRRYSDGSLVHSLDALIGPYFLLQHWPRYKLLLVDFQNEHSEVVGKILANIKRIMDINNKSKSI